MNCPKCGHEMVEGEGGRHCRICNDNLSEGSSTSVDDLTGSLTPGSGQVESVTGNLYQNGLQSDSPWEDEVSHGFFRGLFLTINQTLIQPSDFFRGMPRDGGQWLPIFYCLILGVSGAILGLISETFVESPVMTHGNFIRKMSIASMVALPLLIFMELYLGALVLHLSMMLFGAAKEKFPTTLRIVAYSASPNIFYVVPFVGWLIASIWSLWITVVGIKVTGDVSYGRAVLAALAPVILLIILFAGLFILVLGMVGISSLS